MAPLLKWAQSRRQEMCSWQYLNIRKVDEFLYSNRHCVESISFITNRLIEVFVIDA